MKKYREIIEVCAQRWTDSFGNTYFSCEIYVSDKLFHRQNFHYGYGYSFETYAANYLKQNYINGNKPELVFNQDFVNCPSRWCRENNIKWISRVQDVNRKKDLHGEGKSKNNF